MAVITILLLGGVIGVVATRIVERHPGPSPTTSTTTPPGSIGNKGSATTIQLTSEAPVNGSTGVNGAAAIVLSFSSALSPTSPLPTLTPTTAGTWSRAGTTLTFTPTTGFIPLSAVTVTIPAGPTGVTSSSGAHLTEPATEQFHVANGSIIRLQQLLSLLGYSPLAWTSAGTAVAPTDTSAQVAALFSPPTGTFAWRNTGWPSRLLAMWRPGADNLFTRGLIMSFQADHELDPNGDLTSALWLALVDAVSTNSQNSGGYNYALADKTAPESLTIYHDGAVVLRSPANTGVAASPTPDGTFPVNTRLRRQVMKGTNPNGQKYADLVQYIAYFHGNDAVHYMNRDDYGIPQSLGCVELPLADAAKAWPYLAYGTLVTVIH
ncbi:MAG TPA: L,D-transpeptidase [Acidimicrobiales bacterium]